MKIAVFSDVHGNMHALGEVIKSINAHEPDLIVCLGDLVGYGAFPEEVVETIVNYHFNLVPTRDILSD